MKIRYVGPSTIRVIEPYRWDKANGHVVDVAEPETVADLLTHPPGDFALDETDPLVQFVGDIDRAGTLALHGITEPAHLATLDKTTIKKLITELGVSEQQLRGWTKSSAQEE